MDAPTNRNLIHGIQLLTVTRCIVLVKNNFFHLQTLSLFTNVFLQLIWKVTIIVRIYCFTSLQEIHELNFFRIHKNLCQLMMLPDGFPLPSQGFRVFLLQCTTVHSESGADQQPLIVRLALNGIELVFVCFSGRVVFYFPTTLHIYQTFPNPPPGDASDGRPVTPHGMQLMWFISY